MQTKKRHVSGLLLLDKDHGISSNGALQRAKRLYRADKAGHTGNLDPAATGLLPVCLGEATKFSQFLLDADKTYQATIHLGATSTTGDAEGELSPQQPVAVSRQQVADVLERFRGQIEQVPPMHSALKHEGKPLYAYARAGVEIERKRRVVTIYDIVLVDIAAERVRIVVKCSKGTYIRTLAEDIGQALGCGGYLAALRRIAIGDLRIEDSYTLASLQDKSEEERDACLLPFDLLVSRLPEVSLDDDSTYYFRRGQPIWRANNPVLGLVRVYDGEGGFVGMGEVADDGRVHPRRLVVT